MMFIYHQSPFALELHQVLPYKPKVVTHTPASFFYHAPSLPLCEVECHTLKQIAYGLSQVLLLVSEVISADILTLYAFLLFQNPLPPTHALRVF